MRPGLATRMLRPRHREHALRRPLARPAGLRRAVLEEGRVTPLQTPCAWLPPIGASASLWVHGGKRLCCFFPFISMGIYKPQYACPEEQYMNRRPFFVCIGIQKRNGRCSNRFLCARKQQNDHEIKQNF